MLDKSGHRPNRRRPRFEQLEDRRMLATIADVVFLIDESRSARDPVTDTSLVQSWLEDSIPMLESADFQASLKNKGVNDIRYGLVGFGEDLPGNIERYSHSQLLDIAAQDIKGNATQLRAAIGELAWVGGLEDGWDAIEHAIAEYDFNDREGTVPVFILLQTVEGRYDLNKTLTHEGVLAALRSKNVILNSLVVGPNIGANQNNPTEALFDLSPYEITAGDFSNIRVLGVEVDSADGVPDRQHDYHAFNTATSSVPTTLPATRADTLQISFNGSNTGANAMVASGKSILIGQNITGGIQSVLSFALAA